MSTSLASDPTPDPRPGVVTFTARGEQALDELASRLAAECDGTTESVTSLLEQILTADVHDLAAALEIAGPGTQARERRELLDGVDVDESTPGQTPEEAAGRRLGAHAHPTACRARPRFGVRRQVRIAEPSPVYG